MAFHTASSNCGLQIFFHKNALHRIFPKSFIPLYTMVSFTRIPYSEAMRRWKSQDRALSRIFSTLLGLTAAFGVFSLLRTIRPS